MTDDLVSRLRMLIDVAGRDASPIGTAVTVFAPILGQAADEIERLRAIVTDLAAEDPIYIPWHVAKLVGRAREAIGETP